MDITGMAGSGGSFDDDTGFDAGEAADVPSWSDRMAEAAGDYEAIDPEALAGLGCAGG